MKKLAKKPMSLSRETLRDLSSKQLRGVVGGQTEVGPECITGVHPNCVSYGPACLEQ